MVIIETSVFTRLIRELMSDEEYSELQKTLFQHPDVGDVIPGSGGLRKVRWRQKGRGKRGGIRIIYYWVSRDDQIWMLYAYRKARQIDLNSKQLAVLSKIVERWKDEK
jgi:mRNA-degrading endonuclease RelE of RelBE toxin-antitoxin system